MSCADSLISTPLSPYAEGVRRVRIGIDRALARSGGPRQAQGQGIVVMVTSPGSGEGKTTLSLALGRAYAQAGQRTLLVDCNLRDPGLHMLLGREPATGLGPYLTGLPGPEALRNALGIDESSSLRLMLGLPTGERPTEPLLTGEAFTDLIATTRRHFDIVILDTPAIGQTVDGLCIATVADFALLVLHWSRTGRRPAMAAARSLRNFLTPGATTMVVLNQRSIDQSKYWLARGGRDVAAGIQ